jgi:excisionase family DNA binding protein
VSAVLDKKEAAKFLKVSLRKIDYLREAGELPWFAVGRCVRFLLVALEEFVRKRLTVSTEKKNP